MRTTTREDFSRWLDEKVLNPASEGPQADVVVSSGLKAASPLSRAASKARERAKARRVSLPGGLSSVMAGGYTNGFRQALRLPASFQLVRVDGLETIEKGACTVLIQQAVACEFQGRRALRVEVRTESEGGRLGRVGAFSDQAFHYYEPETLRLLGWEQASRVINFEAALSEPAQWQIGRSYALGSSTVRHKDGRLLESFVQRAELSEANPVAKMSALAKRLQPTFPSAADTRSFSLALRSFSVDDTSDQSAVLELFEFELGPRGVRTKSHNICSVQESLEFGNVLQMTMIRCP
jgi:hypothetical protein